MNTEIHEQLICLSAKASCLWNGKKYRFCACFFPFSLHKRWNGTTNVSQREASSMLDWVGFQKRRKEEKNLSKFFTPLKKAFFCVAENEARKYHRKKCGGGMLMLRIKWEQKKFPNYFCAEKLFSLLGKRRSRAFCRKPQHARISIALPSNH